MTKSTGRAQEGDYVLRKVAHMKRLGIPADISKSTGAAQPEWRKGEIEAQRKRQSRRSKRRTA